jgi:hypothetical protein
MGRARKQARLNPLYLTRKSNYILWLGTFSQNSIEYNFHNFTSAKDRSKLTFLLNGVVIWPKKIEFHLRLLTSLIENQTHLCRKTRKLVIAKLTWLENISDINKNLFKTSTYSEFNLDHWTRQLADDAAVVTLQLRWMGILLVFCQIHCHIV